MQDPRQNYWQCYINLSTDFALLFSEVSIKIFEDDGDDEEDERRKFQKRLKYPDPVKKQKKKDWALLKKPLEVIPEKHSLINAKITPSMG